MDLCVVGAGYVGLVAGACFASKGHRVVCADIDSEKVAGLQSGIVPIYEPGLEALVRAGLADGTLRFTDQVADAIECSKIAFIAVGTPPKRDGSSDLNAVLRVADVIGSADMGATTVVIKSTVPVGTADLLRGYLARVANRPIEILNNPEFLREGRAVEDFLDPHRIVIGVAYDDLAAADLVDIYSAFVSRERILVMDSRSAELSKYAANAFLATKLSFINEIAQLAEAVGADVERVRGVMGMDPRIGGAYLAPGIGYGGSCLPKDVSSLLHLASVNRTVLGVLTGVQKANEAQPLRLFERLSVWFPRGLAGVRVGVWGVAFKPGTDDIREAPSLALVRLLVEAGASVVVFDPIAMTHAQDVLQTQVGYASEPYACLHEADALVVATEWEHFRNPDWDLMRRLMRGRLIFDGRNMYEPQSVAAEGFAYHCVGRPVAIPEESFAARR